MEPAGEIKTPFLSARLPRWAGIRQNVIGSDIHGNPVAPPDGSGNQIVRGLRSLEDFYDTATLDVPDYSYSSLTVLDNKVENVMLTLLQLRKDVSALQKMILPSTCIPSVKREKCIEVCEEEVSVKPPRAKKQKKSLTQ
ncbi:pIX [Bottlenose dolphin adenovirus 1]|uniref:PIX n=1 Tax=Bottlenose dolphin adenovirus 1 TaxID=1714377 RepID=A0A1X7MPR9_9ADEN|nr:pIX [Bottlenose dolphin adenovirus 1]SMG83438.1 pIX [Bottlenose dolphin adenovirus 1]